MRLQLLVEAKYYCESDTEGVNPRHRHIFRSVTFLCLTYCHFRLHPFPCLRTCRAPPNVQCRVAKNIIIHLTVRETGDLHS